MMRYCVDACVLVASISPYEIGYEQSRDFIDTWELETKALVCPELTLVEVAAALSRASGLEERGLGAVDYLKKSVAFKFIHFDARLMRLTVERAAHFRLRAGDASYVTLAMRYRLPIITLDREIIRVAEQTGEFQAMTPRQALLS